MPAKKKWKLSERAKNILLQVCKDIREEPLRLDMSSWMGPGDDLSPCGTTACIAGFIVLQQKRIKKPHTYWVRNGSWMVQGQATYYLAGGEIQSHSVQDLFHVEYWPSPFKRQYLKSDINIPSGRRKAASIAIRRIKHFIKTGE